MEWIRQAFKPAKLTNNTLEVNECGPDDIILHRAFLALSQDKKLKAIFQDRIEAVPVLDPYDFRTMPRLRVGLYNRGPSEAPTALIIDQVRLLIEFRYELSVIRRVETGDATIATLIRYVEKLMRSDANRLLSMDVGSETGVPLAMKSNLLGVSFRPDRDPETGNVALTNTMEWQYRVDVDRDTLKIANVLKAGG